MIQAPYILFPERGRVVLQEGEIQEPHADQVLVKTAWSLMSAGTELTCLHSRFAAGTHWPLQKFLAFPPPFSTLI